MAKKFHILLTFFLILSVVFPVLMPTGSVKAAETKDIVILGTSDIHGNVDNYDYFTDSVPTGSAQRGLTKVFTYVKGVMASNPNPAAGWIGGKSSADLHGLRCSITRCQPAERCAAGLPEPSCRHFGQFAR